MSAGIIRMPSFDEERLFDFVFKDVKPSCIYVEEYGQTSYDNHMCTVRVKNNYGAPDWIQVYSPISLWNDCIIVDRRALGKFNRQFCQMKRNKFGRWQIFLDEFDDQVKVKRLFGAKIAEMIDVTMAHEKDKWFEIWQHPFANDKPLFRCVSICQLLIDMDLWNGHNN